MRGAFVLLNSGHARDGGRRGGDSLTLYVRSLYFALILD